MSSIRLIIYVSTHILSLTEFTGSNDLRGSTFINERGGEFRTWEKTVKKGRKMFLVQILPSELYFEWALFKKEKRGYGRAWNKEVLG